jgi:hypothetical protein
MLLVPLLPITSQTKMRYLISHAAPYLTIDDASQFAAQVQPSLEFGVHDRIIVLD